VLSIDPSKEKQVLLRYVRNIMYTVAIYRGDGTGHDSRYHGSHRIPPSRTRNRSDWKCQGKVLAGARVLLAQETHVNYYHEEFIYQARA
jgi:hypothetical protein